MSTFITLCNKKQNKQMCLAALVFPAIWQTIKKFPFCAPSQFQLYHTDNTRDIKKKKNYKLSANSLPHGIIIFFPFIYISYIYATIHFDTPPWEHILMLFVSSTNFVSHTITQKKIFLYSSYYIIFHWNNNREHKNLWVCLWHISNLTFSFYI